MPCTVVPDPGPDQSVHVQFVDVPSCENVVALPDVPSVRSSHGVTTTTLNDGDVGEDNYISTSAAPIGCWINHSSNQERFNANISSWHFGINNNRIVYHVSSTKFIPKDSQVLMDYGPDGLALERRTKMKYLHTTAFYCNFPSSLKFLYKPTFGRYSREAKSQNETVYTKTL
jgi:hypothetical protein